MEAYGSCRCSPPSASSLATLSPATMGAPRTAPPVTNKHAFTLAEVLIALSVFGIIATVVSGLFIDSYRESRRAASQNQLYEDARFIMDEMARNVREGMIDYDEYYNQYVIAKNPILGHPSNYGQNYGRYYSAFFYPGTDNKLGFDCNSDADLDGTLDRNKKDCTPLRRTIDRATGQNPFEGKLRNDNLPEKENAFCGTISYERGVDNLDNEAVDTSGQDLGDCRGNRAPTAGQIGFVPELYLISADARFKTIFARERTGLNSYALSMLRLEGKDSNNDGLYDAYVCAEGFQCRGPDNAFGVPVPPANEMIHDCPAVSADTSGQLPRSRSDELNPTDDQLNAESCDTAAIGFTRDFVPVSALRVRVAKLQFLIAPLENPHYAFAEKNELTQPRVTIVLTVEPNPDYVGARDELEPFTVVETVSTRLLEPIPAPILKE